MANPPFDLDQRLSLAAQASGRFAELGSSGHNSTATGTTGEAWGVGVRWGPQHGGGMLTGAEASAMADYFAKRAVDASPWYAWHWIWADTVHVSVSNFVSPRWFTESGSASTERMVVLVEGLSSADSTSLYATFGSVPVKTGFYTYRFRKQLHGPDGPYTVAFRTSSVSVAHADWTYIAGP